MLPGLVLGLLGLAFGVGGAVLSSPVLGVAAGACALGAAGAALAAMRRVQEAEREATSAIDAVTLRHLELFTAAGNRSVVDVETGLPDQRFFELALDGRVAAARRHLWPMTLVLVDLTVDADHGDERVTGEALASFATLLRRTLRESDIACRLTGHRFGILQIHRRISSPDALEWSDHCREMFGGLYPLYSFGQLTDRCFVVNPLSTSV